MEVLKHSPRYFGHFENFGYFVHFVQFLPKSMFSAKIDRKSK